MNEIMQIAKDPHSIKTLEMARKAASSSATMLIMGETGVGKELIARFIHQNSAFHNGQFVSVNCAALPENMIEAILFGYEKGAFTHAINSYPGKFEQAHNGTLLLDEVSEIPFELQAKLLRVLQEREVERLGGKNLIKVNVRIIAASNRDLKQLVDAGLFRSDLYYRLNVIPIYCAALRNRPKDIIPLAEYFITKHSAILEKTIPVLTDSAKEKLLNYSWPGNVREMENVIQRALVLTTHSEIQADDIALHDEECSQLDSTLKMNEAKVILDVLNEAEGSRSIAAKKLNISPRTLRYKISKLRSIGLKVP